MTALTQYQLLESPGLWRDTPHAQRRDVIVKFGDASLVLADPRTETALVHWSLPAVERRNPGGFPAIYAPGTDAVETLEIDDADMITALEKVHGAIESARPRPGRLRGVLSLAGIAIVVGLGVFWLPGALVRNTAGMLPPAARAEVGNLVLADLSRVTGAPCTTPDGIAALGALSERLFGVGGPRIVILREAADMQSIHLPGPIVALNRALIEGAKTPDAAAGFVLMESLRAGHGDAMEPVLTYAGLKATVGLLTSGKLDPAAIANYGKTILQGAKAARPDEATLLARFESAGVSSSAFGYALDRSGETTLGLIEADPFRSGTPAPILAPSQWQALQGICGQ